MFRTAPGVTIPFPEKIKEESQVHEGCIRFHLSFEKLGPMLEDFIVRLEEPLFFAMHLPLTRDEEQALRPEEHIPAPGRINKPHDKVCYLDGQSKEQIRAILREYGEVLLSDGMSQLAVASHVTDDEMFIMKYKLVDIYCEQPQGYFDLLEKYGVTRTDKLLTVWDTFSRDAPGQTRLAEFGGITAYEVYEALAKQGMYEAKIVDG